MKDLQYFINKANNYNINVNRDKVNDIVYNISVLCACVISEVKKQNPNSEKLQNYLNGLVDGFDYREKIRQQQSEVTLHGISNILMEFVITSDLSDEDKLSVFKEIHNNDTFKFNTK